MKGARFASNEGFSIESATVDGANIGLRAFDAAAASEKDGGLPMIAHLNLHGVRARLFFADGESLDVPPMDGGGRLQTEKSLLRLASRPASKDDPEHPLPAGSGGQWTLRAEGDFFGDYRAAIRFADVPLESLRPLLPRLHLPARQGVPEYGGKAAADVVVRGGASGVQVKGKLALTDVALTQGGDSFRAARVGVVVDAADGDGVRRLAEVNVRDWLYQAALRPLPPLPVAPASSPLAGGGDVHPAGPDGAMSPDIHVRDWRIERLLAENGRISLGRAGAVAATHIRISARHLARDVSAPFLLSGRIGDGAWRMRGRVMLQPRVFVSGKAMVQDMLPFVLNDWLHLSGMPRFIRGRMDLRLQISQSDRGRRAGTLYHGSAKLRLRRGELEAGSFPEDPLIQRGGSSLQALFDRLNRHHEAHVAFVFDGDSAGERPLDVFGKALLQAMNRDAAGALPRRSEVAVKSVAVTRIRLQGAHGVSLNERVRLRGMIRRLQKQPALTVELVPQLADGAVDDAMRARVRRSQRMIEGYMRKFGIARRRIFPVWPLAAQHRSDAPGIIIRAYAL